MCLLVGLGLMAAGLPEAAAQETNDKVNYQSGFYYTIQEGDTLWDLSQRFNDTPWQWPDLWKENKQIPNPNWIYPGERIRLFLKKDYHRYQKPQQDQKQIGPADAQISASTVEEPPKPVVHFVYPAIDRIGFIRKPPVKPLGSILKSRSGNTLISEGDIVYLKGSESGKTTDFSPGMRLTVYRTLSPTDEPNAQQEIGTQHLIAGIAEVAKAESEYAIAQITQTYRKIVAGDLVMAYMPRDPQIEVLNSTPGIDGHLIVSEDHNQLLAEQFIVFIDKGKQDKILPGQVYNIYKQIYHDKGNSEKPLPLDKSYIGSLLVLLTEETTSTAIITDSQLRMAPGQPFQSQ